MGGVDGGWVTALIAGLLSGGGIAFVGTLIKGVGTLRSGARAAEREAVADLARSRDDAEDRAREREADRDYWARIANRYYGQLERLGVEPNPPNPIPPSER
jgi:hypothetical protein